MKIALKKSITCKNTLGYIDICPLHMDIQSKKIEEKETSVNSKWIFEIKSISIITSIIRKLGVGEMTKRNASEQFSRLGNSISYSHNTYTKLI